MRSRPFPVLLSIGVAMILVVGAPAASADPAEPGGHGAPALNLGGADSVYLQSRRVDIAPGLDLTSFQRLQPGGWVTGHVMTADLSTPSLSLDLADGGTVSDSKQTVSAFAQDSHAVAAVNGDYFDLNASEAPVGTDVSSAGVRNASSEPRQAFTLADGKAAIQQLMSAASYAAGGSTTQLGSVNSPSFAANSVGLFNQVWGDFPIARLLTADEPVRIVTVVGGAVTAVSTDRSTITDEKAIPAGTSILVGRGTATAQLASLSVGTKVDLAVHASADVDLAVGGSQRLLTDGTLTTLDEVTAGRTAIGVSKDGATLRIVSVDGRQGDSHGMTIQELAQLLHDLGAWNAINLDGGGSTALVARPAGTDQLSVIDRPSDGTERTVSNALVFRSSAGPKKPSNDGASYGGVLARSVLQPAAGLTAPTAGDLLPGLTRTGLGDQTGLVG